MIERLRRALEHADELLPDVQEELAAPIEIQPLTNGYHSDVSEADLPQIVRDALAVIGARRDMQNDDEFAAPERIRHGSVPTPPIELDGL